MKRIILFAVAALLLAACNTNNNPEMRISLDPDEIKCPDAGGEYLVMLTCPDAWTAKADNAWVTVSPAQGNGDTEVRIKISANKETIETTSQVTFTSDEGSVSLLVRRAAKAAPQLRVVSETDINTPREGGTYTISVQSNIQWQVDKTANWVTLDKGMGKNNGSVTMTIAAATTPETTTATVTVSQYAGSGAEPQVITIKRGGTDATSLSVDNSAVNAPADGGNYTVNITSSCRWRVSQEWDTEEWLSLYGTTEGLNDGTFGITVEPAASTNAKTGVITVTELRDDNYKPVVVQVVVSREGKEKATLSVEPAAISAPAEGGEFPVEIKCNYSWHAVISSAKVATLSAKSGDGDATLVISVLPATGFKQSICNITISSDFGAEKAVINIRREPLKPVFSVAAATKVLFSPANLWYNPKLQIRRFADHAYDVIGDLNLNVADNYDGWIDLFVWGSGSNPAMLMRDRYKLIVFNDWGCKPVNGDDAFVWRTLTIDEWYYLVYKRKNAEQLRGKATVNNMHGYVLLPDNWMLPDGLSFTPDPEDWLSNAYTPEKWDDMQQNGAVFLPAAGMRTYAYIGEEPTFDIKDVNVTGHYWASTYFQPVGNFPADGECMIFSPSNKTMVSRYGNLNYASSVRLVKELK